ncbi:ACT domain-containing protein ACR10-like [Prunus persica]|uniref:ACT domain-containing protein ACR10-like n=1 Tax=Prunus persica TaxID=3760 RepID=UPI0009AB2A48|nr:ACT domain-containing protein ACR10-like [Prunus persica]
MSFWMRSFRYIEEIKEPVERECPGAVSCSGILVLSAREGVVRDVVVISKAEKVGEPTVITANCPNKTGLGCDLCRVILLFGRSICR